MMFNKVCGFNKTHTTGLHGKYKANKSYFPSQLHPTHTCSNMIKYNSPAMHIQPPPYKVPPSTRNNASLFPLNEEQMVINSSKWKSVLEHHENTSKNSEIADLCSSLKELLK